MVCDCTYKTNLSTVDDCKLLYEWGCDQYLKYEYITKVRAISNTPEHLALTRNFHKMNNCQTINLTQTLWWNYMLLVYTQPSSITNATL